MYVGCKGGNKDTFVAVVKHVVKGCAHGAFAHGVTLALGIGTVGHQEQNPFSAKLTDSSKVNHFTVNGC